MASRFTTSISAKLFYLMTFIVLVTVIGVSVQSSQKFKAYLTQNIQDGSQSQAERAATDTAAIIESWVGKVSVILSKINTKEQGQKSSEELVDFLRKNNELITMSVFVTEGTAYHEVAAIKSPLPPEADKENIVDPRYEDRRPSEIKTKAIELSRANLNKLLKSDRATDVSFFSLGPDLRLPLMQVAVRFDISGSATKKAYVFLTAWQTRILVELPKSRFTKSMIIDSDGNIFASPLFNEFSSRINTKSSPLVRTALSKKAPSGFQDIYRSQGDRERLGAYAQVSAYPSLFVLVEKDADAAFRVITRTYISSALWAALFVLIAIMVSYLSARSATKTLRELVAVTKEISSGNFEVRVTPQTSDEIAELGHSVNHMASKITELMSTQVEKARYEKELETARMVQSTFFPKQDVRNSCLTVTGYYQPATECGGDLWGHYVVDEDRQFVFIADAMGHGAPAALVTAIGYATCQAVATIFDDEPGLDASPGRLLERLNRIIFDAVDGKISMTFFGLLFDFKNGTMTYANAGHNFPVVLTADKDDDRLSKGAKAKAASGQSYIIPMTLQGVPLGVDRTATFKEKTLSLKASDKILFFTDGLIENHLPGSNPFGRKQLLEMLTLHGAGDCFEIKNRVLDQAIATFGSSNLADDVTIVVAEISAVWTKSTGAPTLSSSPSPNVPMFLDADVVSPDKTEILPGGDTADAASPSSVSTEADLNVATNVERRFKLKLPGAG